MMVRTRGVDPIVTVPEPRLGNPDTLGSDRRILTPVPEPRQPYYCLVCSSHPNRKQRFFATGHFRLWHIGSFHFGAMRNLVAIRAKRASTKARQSSSIYEYAHKCVLPTANWMRICREAARLCADFIPPRDLPVTICGDPQLSRDRAIRHKPLQQPSLAQRFPASWPNRLFRRICSGPMNKSPSSFRPSSPRHQRLVGTSQRRWV